MLPSTTMDATLLQAIAALPRDEQIELIEAVWDRLAAQDEAPALSEAQRQELDRRLDSLSRDASTSLSWEQVRARARG